MKFTQRLTHLPDDDDPRPGPHKAGAQRQPSPVQVGVGCHKITFYIRLTIIAVNIQETKDAKKVDTINTFIIGVCLLINNNDKPLPKINPTGKPMSIPNVELS